jgi:uncharacterized membrane protein HdeD (DUF308 family)
MGIVSSVKNFKWGYLIISVLLCACGLCFLVFNKQPLKIVAYIIGVACLLVGIILAVKVLSQPERGFKFGITIIFAILTMICGLVSIILNDKVIEVYPMFIGLFIVIDGAFKLQTVINAKRYRLKLWWFLLIFSCFTILSGFLIIRIPFTQDNANAFTMLLGLALILSGLENFFSLFYFGKIVKRVGEEYVLNTIKRTDTTEE